MKAITWAALFLLLVTPEAAIARESGEARIVEITAGADLAPGVEADAITYVRPTGAPGRFANQASATTGSSAPAGPPAPVAISPHNCIPRTDARGVSLDFTFFESGVADCVSFVSPPPAPPGPERRGRRPARPSPQALAQRAYDRMVSLAPSPELDVAPARVGLTGLTSYFWVGNELRPITATAGVRGLTVRGEARPVRFLWDFGDGTTRTTRHGGRAWSPRQDGNVGHLYETKGRYEPEVTVVWVARWRVNGGAWQDLGYFSTSDSDEYPVREMIAVLVRRR